MEKTILIGFCILGLTLLIVLAVIANKKLKGKDRDIGDNEDDAW